MLRPNHRLPALLALVLGAAPLAHGDWEDAQAVRVTNQTAGTLVLTLSRRDSRVGVSLPPAAGAAPVIQEMVFPEDGLDDDRLHLAAGQTVTFWLSPVAEESVCSAWLSVQDGGTFLGMLSVVADFPQPYRSYAEPWHICGEQDLACRWGGQAWVLEPRGAAQGSGQAGGTSVRHSAPTASKRAESKALPPVDESAPKDRFQEAKD